MGVFSKFKDLVGIEEEYEDDDYVYYVKAVPKIKITSEKVEIKDITRQKETENSQSERREDKA